MKVLLFGRCFDGTIMFTLLLWVIVSFYFQVHPDPTRTLQQNVLWPSAVLKTFVL